VNYFLSNIGHRYTIFTCEKNFSNLVFVFEATPTNKNFTLKLKGPYKSGRSQKWDPPLLFLRSSSFCSNAPSNFWKFFYLGQGAQIFFWNSCFILGTSLLRLYGPQIDGPWAPKSKKSGKAVLGIVQER
jgi:hypothetical protein